MSRLKAHAELQRPILEAEDIGKIFQNVEDLVDLHERLYSELKNLSSQNKLASAELGKLLLKFIPFFKLYNSYVMGFESAAALANALRKKNKDLAFFLDVCELVEKNTLESFLIMPVQRLPRYILLLTGLLKNTGRNFMPC